ncbi:hypothetical protein RBH29_16730 [Herbivorax sp. ANBcel31]|nr:hypothetical protein [Herbivorax sp. ANBcel31]MDQ2088075.1 hypothetical protein [Herbivorax sp. ANBcel31]
MKKTKYIVEEVFDSKDTQSKKKSIEKILINIIRKTEANKIYELQ